jgi:hypothetical protein
MSKEKNQFEMKQSQASIIFPCCICTHERCGEKSCKTCGATKIETISQLLDMENKTVEYIRELIKENKQK